MNKKFLSAILFGALVASTGSFVSCADNDDKIDQLQDQNSELKAQLAQLKSELQAELKNAASASQVSAIEAKLSAIESATAENLAATVAALKGDYNTQEARVIALETQIKALETLQNEDAAAIIEALNKAKERDNADMAALSALVNGLDAQVNTLLSEVRALVFQPEFYLDGIEAAEYTYLRYVALNAGADKYGTEGDQKNLDGNIVKIKSPEWQYAHVGDIDAVHTTGYLTAKSTSDLSDGWGTEKLVGEDVPNTVQFAVNPSNAKLDLNMILKNVCAMTRADEASAKILAVSEPKNGIVTVTYEIHNPGALITANNVEKTPGFIFNKPVNTTVFKLSASVDADVTVESDWGVLYETAIWPVAVALNATGVADGWKAPITCKENELHKNPYEALADVPTFKLAYDDKEGVNMAEHIELHMVKSDLEKTGKKDGAHIAISLADAKAKYGLTYEFYPVEYTADGNVTCPTNYSTMTDATGKANVVANIVNAATGKAEVGVQGESSTGKQPLYQVLVKKGSDVVLDAYIKIIIVRQVKPIVSEEFPLGEQAFNCGGLTFGQKWHQVSTLLLQNAVKMSKEEFFAKYELQKDGDYAVLYSAPNTVKADQYTKVYEKVDEYETTNTVLEFKLDEYAQQYIIEKKEGMSDVIYVKYVSKYNVNHGKDYDMGIDPDVYVPLQFSLTNPAKFYTYEKKNVNFWYAADGTPNITPDEALRFNVNYPEDKKNTKTFVRDLNDAWEGKVLKLSGVNKETVKQYYFHPLTNGVKIVDEYSVEGKKFEYTLSVESNTVTCKMWNANHKETVTDNIFDLETLHKIDVTDPTSIYNNTLLKATFNGTTEVIATLNQKTGEIDYKNDSELAKRVLNAVGHEKAEAKAYVGLFAKDECGNAIAIKDNVFPVYFLRPIDIKAGDKKNVVDAKANADYVTLFDMFTFTDWRDVDFFNKATNDYKNVWLLAYYNVNTIKVDLKNILTDMNEHNPMVALSTVNKDVKVSYVDAAGNELPDGVQKLNMAAYNKESMGVKSTYDEIVKYFGKIKYENKGANVSNFTLKIPVEFGYDWGTIYKTVEIFVDGSMANHEGE